jgi:2-dehydropantoate 2-reductase
MRAVVVGAGAMGASLAAHAARAGHEVTVVDVSRAVVDEVTAHGIQVTAPEGDFQAAVRATEDAASVGVADVVVVFVKAQHTADAGKAIRPLVGAETAVATLQNGWGNAERLATFLPGDQLVVGVTYNSCTSQAPGRVLHSGRGRTVVGPYQDDGDQRFAARVADLLNSAGWQAEASEQVRTEIWKKLVLNAATLPVAALTRLPAGGLGRPGEVRDLVDALAAEAVAVAAAQGLAIELDERIEAIHAVLERAGDGKPSMLQDVLADRKTEIETVNGAVVAAGTERDLEVPLNQAMIALVHGLERSYQR